MNGTFSAGMDPLRFLLGKARLRKLLVEFVDTARRVDKLHLTGKEGVRKAGDFQFYQRIFLAVFPDDRVFRRRARVREEGLVAGEVLKDNQAVIFRMNIVLHDPLFILFSK